jgi:hypothetical protein
MSSFERICPQCGTNNEYSRDRCIKCRAPLTAAAASTPPPPPVNYFSRGGMARLAWRATKFFARTGFNLALAGTLRGIENVQNRNKQDVKNEMIDGDYSVPSDRSTTSPDTSSRTGSSSGSMRANVSPPQPTRLNDWRVYSKPPAQETNKKQERISWGKKP